MGLAVDVLAQMLNLEIKDNPHYTGLEIQVFDDVIHGTGTVVLLTRAHDGRTDVYQEPGLRLDPAGYAIGNGLGEWHETEFEPHRVDFLPDGVDVEFGFSDHFGREIGVRVYDRTGRPRRPAAFLAPMGSSIRDPNRLPLVWMSRFDLVRHGGTLEISIDGNPVRIGRLPGSGLHRRELVKYASDLFVVAVNPAFSGPIDTPVLGDISTGMGGHRALLRLDKGKRLEDLSDFEETQGSWRLLADDAQLIRGSWSARKAGSRLLLGMEVLDGWHPRRLPLFMKLVTTAVPLFRRWPTTYRWHAEIDLDRGWMDSGWSRTDETGDSSYQARTSRPVPTHRRSS